MARRIGALETQAKDFVHVDADLHPYKDFSPTFDPAELRGCASAGPYDSGTAGLATTPAEHGRDPDALMQIGGTM